MQAIATDRKGTRYDRSVLLPARPAEVQENDHEICCNQKRLGVSRRSPPAAELSSCGHVVDCSSGPHRRTRSLWRGKPHHPSPADKGSILKGGGSLWGGGAC